MFEIVFALQNPVILAFGLSLFRCFHQTVSWSVHAHWICELFRLAVAVQLLLLAPICPRLCAFWGPTLVDVIELILW